MSKYDLDERALFHADAIMRAAGSKFAYYEAQSKAKIQLAVIDALGEAVKAGVSLAMERVRTAGLGDSNHD